MIPQRGRRPQKWTPKGGYNYDASVVPHSSLRGGVGIHNVECAMTMGKHANEYGAIKKSSRHEKWHVSNDERQERLSR